MANSPKKMSKEPGEGEFSFGRGMQPSLRQRTEMFDTAASLKIPLDPEPYTAFEKMRADRAVPADVPDAEANQDDFSREL